MRIQEISYSGPKEINILVVSLLFYNIPYIPPQEMPTKNPKIFIGVEKTILLQKLIPEISINPKVEYFKILYYSLFLQYFNVSISSGVSPL